MKELKFTVFADGTIQRHHDDMMLSSHAESEEVFKFLYEKLEDKVCFTVEGEIMTREDGNFIDLSTTEIPDMLYFIHSQDVNTKHQKGK